MLDIKPTHKPIKEYFEELAAFDKHGQFNEMTIRNAFQDLLQTYTKKIGWQFIEEYTIQRKGRRNASVDGAILDQFSLPRGFWEAKDSKDDLATEVRKKFEDGYPQSNILFWQPGRVILYQAAQKVLDARALFPESSLAVLYDPLTMPPELDKAVDLTYRPQPFPSEAKRMEFLFELYEKYTANLFTKEKVKKSAKKATGKAKE